MKKSKHDMIKKPNWQESKQLVIYKCGRSVELGTTEKQFYIPSYNYWNVFRFLRPFSFDVDFADVYAQANP